jgi:hypothetical protein
MRGLLNVLGASMSKSLMIALYCFLATIRMYFFGKNLALALQTLVQVSMSGRLACLRIAVYVTHQAAQWYVLTRENIEPEFLHITNKMGF